MGAKISKCSASIGGHKFKKKEKGPKTVRHASIISLNKAQIYDDVSGSNGQTQNQGQEEVPTNNLAELSVQLVEEYDEHLKTIKEAALQKPHQPLTLAHSTNTVYYDFSEDNESFYDAQSDKEKSDDECVKYEHQLKTTKSAQTLSASKLEQQIPIQSSINKEDEIITEDLESPKTIESSINFNQSRCQEQTQPTVLENKSESSEDDHQKEKHKYLTNVSVHAVADHSSDSDSEISDDRFNNTRLEFDNPSSFDNIDLSTNLSDVAEKNTDNDDNLKSIISTDRVSALEKELRTNDQIRNEDSNKTTRNSVDYDKSSISIQSESSSPRPSFVTAPNLSENVITSVVKHSNSTASSESEEFQAKGQEPENKINDETKEKHIPSKDVLDQEHLIKKLSTSSSEAESEYTNKAVSDADSSNFALSDATRTIINELKIIIESISVLERDIIAEADSQNTYQALMKIMMQVNQIKNANFDEEILNLQNQALHQISHCLKILKK